MPIHAKPETIVVSITAILLLCAASLFGTGAILDFPNLRQIAFWIFAAAVCVASLPLAFFLTVLAYERLKPKSKK
jgi:divalent metal cation (Fe/Co/Zn/Cd) transporter